MRILIDTNILIWAASDDPVLTPAVRAILGDARADLLLSPVSVWEIGIKVQIGKLKLGEDLAHFVPKQMVDLRLTELQVDIRHALRFASLPLLHKDPFDRLLAAQALAESLPMMTPDKIFAKYGVRTIW